MRPAPLLVSRDYKEPPFTQEGVLDSFCQQLDKLINFLGPRGCFMDDMLVWFRHFGFMDDPKFIDAFKPHIGSVSAVAKIWRIHTLCWAAESTKYLEGVFADLGTYDGKAIEVVARHTPGDWCLYDTFDHHPAEESKNKHGPNLEAKVRKRHPKARVIKGLLPDSLLNEPIAFAHIDMNDPIAETEALKRVYSLTVPGGIIVLDDYGFTRYRASYESEKAFLTSVGAMAYECPTGQGIVVKR